MPAPLTTIEETEEVDDAGLRVGLDGACAAQDAECEHERAQRS